jgi:hypothetical protein
MLEMYDHGAMLAFMAERRAATWIIGMVTHRPGVLLAAVAIEYLLYAPGTEANDSYDIIGTRWEDEHWLIVGVPRRDRTRWRPVFRACGLRVADGTPTMLTVERGEPKATYFPAHGRNCFALEFRGQHPCYSLLPASTGQRAMVTRMFKRQDTLIELIVERGWRPSLADLEKAFLESAEPDI